MTGAGLILEGRGITRRYPGTVALDAVDFRVYRNQVNVLIGENGAGKSTLMRILAGVEPADSGELLLDGARVAFRSPRDASRHGIAIVHQELSILPNLDLTDNLFAGRELRTAGLLVNRPDEERRSLQALQRLQRPMDVRSLAGHLPLGCRQLVEIARALDQQAKILILDEPTSALSNPEAESLFNVIAELKRSGVTVIYISHRLNELLYLGDFFTVLRSGRVVGEGSRAEVNRQWIVQRMSGRDIQTKSATPAIALAKQMLKVDHLTLAPGSELGADMVSVREISFTLGRGEILGVYGLFGSGRTELLEAIAGLRRVVRGTIELERKSLRIQSARNAIDAGIHLVPEDRQRDGIVPELSVRENMGLAGGRGMFLRPAQETEHALQLIKDLNIRTPDLEVPITALSGGNQQKVLIARCLMRSPILLLLDEPTRGVDVGAKAEIHEILRQLAQKGVGIIFSSSEIEETQALADRTLVLCQGGMATILERSQMTDEALFTAASPRISEAEHFDSGAISK